MTLIGLVAGGLSLLLALAASGDPGRNLIVRRYRHGRRLRRIFIGVYAGLGLLLITHSLVPHSHTRPHVFEGTLTALLLTFGVTIMALLRARIATPISPAPRRVLAIGAHPDDLELACGASLARLIDAGHEVHGVIMSQGARGGNAEVRPREARRGAAFLGLASLEIHDLPDTQLALTENRMTQLLEEAVHRVQPDMILTHSEHDQHQDHIAVHRATLRAARHHHSVLCYESPSATSGFTPGVFIDVNDYSDVKIEAVATHRDQAGKSYLSPEIVTSITRFRGRQARLQHAEGFEAVRLLATGWL